jgi:nucleotide-binding universal stress UspA family protein
VIGREDSDLHEDGAFGICQGDALLQAGRAVLLSPPNIDTLSGKQAIIAWKDTPGARRAVRDSLPLLQQAEEVTVATVGAQQEENGGIEDVCIYLERHAVNAVPLRMADADVDASEQLFHLAGELGSDLIVAGGYGRCKLNGWTFGATTRKLLTQTPICCVMGL